MFETSIAGSLPKPAWLAETNKLWPQWKAEGDALRQAKADATLLWIKAQEDAGLDIICDGEQARQHFVHGFEPLSITLMCTLCTDSLNKSMASTLRTR